MGLIHPHLPQLGSACPRVSGGDADHASRLVSDHKAQSSTVIVPCCTTVVVVKTFLNLTEFNRRKIVLGLYEGGHPECSIFVEDAPYLSWVADADLAFGK